MVDLSYHRNTKGKILRPIIKYFSCFLKWVQLFSSNKWIIAIFKHFITLIKNLLGRFNFGLNLQGVKKVKNLVAHVKYLKYLILGLMELMYFCFLEEEKMVAGLPFFVWHFLNFLCFWNIFIFI